MMRPNTRSASGEGKNAKRTCSPRTSPDAHDQHGCNHNGGCHIAPIISQRSQTVDGPVAECIETAVKAAPEAAWLANRVAGPRPGATADGQYQHFDGGGCGKRQHGGCGASGDDRQGIELRQQRIGAAAAEMRPPT
ncbi:MAG: hypothetical protein HC779_08675 [Phyllobacteriaceae bacterium]|nr:hypothetical protein [Phyllobacteriaceae bacterium]